MIRVFSVDTFAVGMFPQSVEVLIGDVTDQVADQSAMQGVDAVVHLAALLHIVNPPPELRECEGRRRSTFNLLLTWFTKTRLFEQEVN